MRCMQKQPVSAYRLLLLMYCLLLVVLISQWDGEAEGFTITIPSAEFVFFTMVDEFEAGGGFAQGFGIVAIVVGHHCCAGNFGQDLQWPTDFCPWGGADGSWVNQ